LGNKNDGGAGVVRVTFPLPQEVTILHVKLAAQSLQAIVCQGKILFVDEALI
jgi:hypothetical protein